MIITAEDRTKLIEIFQEAIKQSSVIKKMAGDISAIKEQLRESGVDFAKVAATDPANSTIAEFYEARGESIRNVGPQFVQKFGKSTIIQILALSFDEIKSVYKFSPNRCKRLLEAISSFLKSQNSALEIEGTQLYQDAKLKGWVK